MLLNKQQIQQSLNTEDVTCPDLGGEIRVRELTVGEAQEVRGLGKEYAEKYPPKSCPDCGATGKVDGKECERCAGSGLLLDLALTVVVSVRAAELGIVDEKGGRVFADGEISNLPERHRGSLTLVGEAILRLSAMIPKAREQAEKNSPTPQKDNSSSS